MSGTENNQHLPMVSIGIPTYNRADGYLRECIDSAIRQTYPNIDIVISDNCSSDGTADLVNGIDDPRIRYFRHEQNIGANNNFNYCLEQARGDSHYRGSFKGGRGRSSGVGEEFYQVKRPS